MTNIVPKLPLYVDIPGKIVHVDSNGSFWFAPSHFPEVNLAELKIEDLNKLNR